MFSNKLRSGILLACLLISLVILFTACDKSGGAQGTVTEGAQKPAATETVEESNQESETDGACQHTNTEYSIEKAATCTEKGLSSKLCSDCGAVLESLELSTVAHTEEIIPGRAATCKAEGLTEGKRCSVCKTVLVSQEKVAIIDHTEIIIPSIAATCTKPGYTQSKECSVCGDILVAPIATPPLKHAESDWIIEKPAEIGIDGSKFTKCTRCGDEINREIIPALEEEHVHVGEKWSTQIYASCTSTGVEVFLCSCGLTMGSRTIPVQPHTAEKLLAVSPTCYSTGLTEGSKCAECGITLVAQNVVGKIAHTEEVVLGKAPSCSKYGATDGTKCSVCKEMIVDQLQIPPTGHTFVAGTCSTCGVKEEAYSIWIVDGLGNPVSNIIVKIIQDDEVIKMYPYDGTHLQFSIEKTTYKVELDMSQLKKQYTYDESLCTLTPENTNLVIKLYEKPAAGESLYISAPISADYESVELGAGSYLLSLKQDDYTFFIFRPQKAAIYAITYECTSDLTLSYHGSSFFTQGFDISEDTSTIEKYENGFSLTVYATNVGGDYVFAVKSTSATSCVIKIENAGTPGTRLEDEPWTPYLEDEDMVNKQLSASKDGTYTTIDLTDLSVAAVLNEADGYYHLGTADGPIIFIDLTSDSQFVSSIQMICAHQRMGEYIYDLSGKVVEKRSYNELFMQYGMPETTDSVDEPIRVPLTKKLADAIISFGNKNSWWAEGSEANIFNKVLLGAPYNRDFAWLLFCGYYS